MSSTQSQFDGGVAKMSQLVEQVHKNKNKIKDFNATF
jgi:hypothetical protein